MCLTLGGVKFQGEDFFEKVFLPLYGKYGKPRGFVDNNVEFIIQHYFRNRLSFLTNTSYFNKEVDYNTYICGGLFCGAGKYVIEVSLDGSINLCGRYDKDASYCNIGSIYSPDFLGLFSLKNYINFVERKRPYIDKLKCDNCFAGSFCDHGCMAFHYVKTHTWGIREDLVCSFYKRVASFLTLHEREAFLKFLFYKKKNNVFYIPTSSAVGSSVLSLFSSYLRILGLEHFNAQKDPDWKSEDGKCYQIILKEE